MGTTRTAILTDEGVQLAYCLIIEGYSRVITTWHDLEAVNTAWLSSDFGDPLPGLEITGNIEQRFRPFSPDLEPSTLSFRVVPEETDAFGIAVFKTIPSVWTELSVDFATDSTTLTGKSSGNFPSSGTVYLGTQAITYTSESGGVFSGIAAGKYYPFDTDTLSANQFPNPTAPNSNESVGGWKNTAPPIISDVPRSWVDRKVALFAHRVVGGALDYQGAELLFAGRIDSLSEDGDGATVMECSDYRAVIGDFTCFTDQWRAVPKEGYYLQAGDFFRFARSRVNGGSSNFVEAADLTVVASGASGTDEINEGMYTAEEIASAIDDWINGDSTVTTDGAQTWDYTAGIISTHTGPRFQIHGDRSAAGDTDYWLFLGASDERMVEFLGMSYNKSNRGDGKLEFYGNRGTLDAVDLISPEAPFRSMSLIQDPAKVAGALWNGGVKPQGVQLTGQAGTFRNLTSDLPPELQEHVSGSEVWSLFSVDDKFMFLGRVDSASSPTEINSVVVDDVFGTADFSFAATVLRQVRVGEELPVIKQVACISGTMETVIARILSSTDGNGVNHASYDNLPRGLGVGVSWSLLGDNFLDSVNELEEATDADSVTLIIEKPTKVWDLIAPELVMRGAFLKFADGGYQLGTMQIPNAANADWTLNEDNKSDSRRTAVEHTRDFAVSQVKILYDREPHRDDYRSKYIAVGSNPSFGSPITIKARNSYSGDKGAGEAAETLCEKLTAELLAVFNRPLLRWRRSIAPTLFLAAPGDTVAFTDSWTRSPDSGQRGTSARGGTVLSVSYSFGVASGGQQAMNGSMEILFSDEDRFFPMSYAAESDESLGASAWDSGSKKLYLKQNAFSLSGNDNTYFNDGDAVRILECDPADPTSPDELTDTINGDPGTDGTGDYIVLTTGFGSPAFDSSKIYLVLPDDYGSATSTQKLQAFQADDADGYIVDTIKPNLWGKDRRLGHSRATITRLPSRHSTSLYGDGKPFTPAHMDQAIRMHNNLVNYKLQNGCSLMLGGGGSVTATDGSWRIMTAFPYYIGGGRFASGRRTKLYIGPSIGWDGSTDDLNVRVRLVRHFPFSDGTDSIGPFAEPYQTSDTWTVSTGTTVENLAAKGIPIVRSVIDRRWTIVVLEVMTASEGNAAYLEGFHQIYVSAVS